MDPDELETAVTALQDDLRQLRTDLDRERREREATSRGFDQLSQKLRYPGTKFLVDLEYRLVYEVTTSVGAGLAVIMPALASPPFETLPGKLHALYALSAYLPNDTTDAVTVDGTLIVAPTTTLSVAIQRQQKASPTRMEMRLVLDNAAGTAVTVSVRVWRRLGMGS